MFYTITYSTEVVNVPCYEKVVINTKFFLEDTVFQQVIFVIIIIIIIFCIYQVRRHLAK